LTNTISRRKIMINCFSRLATGKIPIDGDCYACVDGETVIFYRGNWLERKI